MASSAWNCSKDFPAGGITITLGPVGIVAHPLNTSNQNTKKMPSLPFIMTLLAPVRWSRRRYNLQPTTGTSFHVRIVVFGIRAEIPVRLFLYLWCLLNIFG